MAKGIDSVVKEAMERFEESQEGSNFNRADYEDDVRFSRLSDQWTIDGKDYKKERQAEGRPALTVNKLPPFIRQVVNDARQAKPSIQVHPVDNGADVETAEVINGLVRSIERGSSADVAYDTAIDHAVSGGFGFFRIDIDYAHDDSFDMEARIERVPNPLMVHWDVSSTRFDAADWEYAFVSDFYSREAFEKEFPGASTASFDAVSEYDYTDSWLDDDKVRVAEYWLREKNKRNLILFESVVDGQPLMRPIREDQLPRMAKDLAAQGGMDVTGIKDDDLAMLYVQLSGLQERDRREVDYWEVTRRIINGEEELQSDPWPGSTIPICPVWGDEVIIDGRRHFRSMIRDAKDPQRMVNFWRSASTELVALAPRAPWVGPQGFVPKGHEDKWSTANTRSHSYLEYDPAVAPPQRQPFAGVPAGAIQESLNASDDMKAIMGVFDASLGAQGNETSGKAILARQREGDTSNFHFIDNLSRAITYAGKCLVEIIPAVYSARQTIRILGKDQKEKVIKLTQEDGGGVLNEDGERELYNLAVGKYDVTVSSGPSYSTQREETREFLLEIMRQVPGAAEFLGDIALDHMDFQGAKEAADRLRKVMMAKGVLPPEGGMQQPMGLPGVPGQGPEGPMMPPGQGRPIG